MSEDRLKEIKRRLKDEDWLYWSAYSTSSGKQDDAEPDMSWLISELEQSRAEIKRLHENKNVEMVRRIENCLEIAIDRAENAEDEVKRLKERFADG